MTSLFTVYVKCVLFVVVEICLLAKCFSPCSAELSHIARMKTSSNKYMKNYNRRA